MAFLEVRGISAGYGRTKVLDNVSFYVNRDEIAGLLGQNGSGKSTIIKALAGLLGLSGGEIFLGGKKIDRHSFSEFMGYCPQENSFFEKLTVAENMDYFGRLYGVPKKELKERINTISSTLGLAEKLGRLSAELSGGQKRRLNIACGIMHSPSVMLLDEPSLALDPISRYRLWGLIKSINSTGTTTIVSSNSMEEIYSICTQVICIKEGAVVFQKNVNDMRRMKSLNAIFG